MKKFLLPTTATILFFAVFLFIALAGQQQAWVFSGKEMGVPKPLFYDLLSPIPFWSIWMLLMLPVAPFLHFLGNGSTEILWTVQIVYFYLLACAGRSLIAHIKKIQKSYITNTEAETKELGKKIANTLRGGDIMLLQGELGAGKTTLVKGIAEGFGITDDIVSPTFTLMNVYELKANSYKLKALVHIDTYRLTSEQDLIEIGIEDYLGKKDTVCLIEWPEKITSLLEGKKCITISLAHHNNTARSITIDKK